MNNFKLIILVTTCIAFSFEYRLNSSDLCTSIEGCTSTNYRYACGEEFCAVGKIRYFVVKNIFVQQFYYNVFSKL